MALYFVSYFSLMIISNSFLLGHADLLAYTIATEATDGYNRLVQSAKMFNITLQTLGMGEVWQGGDVSKHAGGGHKINIFLNEIEKFKDNKDDVVLFIDGYDVVFTSSAEEIVKTFVKFDARIVFSAEEACWPDASLMDQYPAVKTNERRFLNSGGFIGYANEIHKMLSSKEIRHTDDDQLYFTHIFLNETLRDELKMKLDKRAEIFLNLNGALDEIEMKFKGSQSYVYNVKTGNIPLILHGNGPIKVRFNRLTDYVPNKWTPTTGCRDCDQNTLSLAGIEEADFPSVFMAVFLEYPIPFIEDFFVRLTSLNYPKQKIDLFVHYAVNYHEREVKQFSNEHASHYHSVSIYGPADELSNAMARNKALAECARLQCQYLFAVDGEVQLENKQTLQILIERNRSVIAPLVVRPSKLWSNFWGMVSDIGFYQRSDDYVAIVLGKTRSLWNVPYISSVYLIHGYRTSQLIGCFSDGSVDADIAFANCLREKGIFMYLDNMEPYYGHLVNSEDLDTSHLHNDLYTIFSNPYTWAQKYVHPDYNEALAPDTVNLQPCPDVYQFPVVTTAFCRDLVEEMENLGQWSNGKNEDPRLATGYENVPTVDTHTNQIGWESHWLHFLKQYILPLNLKVYSGYHSEGKSIMNFVVRYKPNEQSFLRPHHDSSTFSVNIALSRAEVDFEGGGTHFLRYNCSVKGSPQGWMLMHPGRLTHYHEGLRVTAGTRYIMVAFVDP